MTLEEAVHRIATEIPGSPSSGYIGLVLRTFESIGGVKFDEPKTVEQEAAEWLRQNAFAFEWRPTDRCAAVFLKKLREGGFKIVRDGSKTP